VIATIIHADQRSPEWVAARLGRLTASVIADAFAKTKSGWGAGRKNLRTRLVLERITGQSQENGFVSADMLRGIELESEARATYEIETGRLVSPVGFLSHPELLTGASPDGFVDADGVIEIKCPKAATHLEYLRGGLPEEYRLQILQCLWLSGRAWGEFVSYHPDFPAPLRLKITRVTATAQELHAHELAVRLFLSEVDAEEREIRGLMTAAA
jgi:hypothetical protein